MKYHVPPDPAGLLGVLGWSTSQGDAAVDGANAATAGDPISVNPWPPSSTLAHPWAAGWVATSAAELAPRSFSSGRRGSGHLDLILRANGAAASLAARVHDPSPPDG